MAQKKKEEKNDVDISKGLTVLPIFPWPWEISNWRMMGIHIDIYVCMVHVQCACYGARQCQYPSSAPRQGQSRGRRGVETNCRPQYIVFFVR